MKTTRRSTYYKRIAYINHVMHTSKDPEQRLKAAEILLKRVVPSDGAVTCGG